MKTAFSHCFFPAPTPPRHWDELMLDEACRRLLDEVSLPGWAPGGRVEFKRTLVVSFFFKFYLQVLQELKNLVKPFPVPVSALAFMGSWQHKLPPSPLLLQTVLWATCQFQLFLLPGFSPSGLLRGEAQDARLSLVHRCLPSALSRET